jgi:hypothetical protein
VWSQEGKRYGFQRMALPYTEIEVDNETFHIFTLPDRRPTAGSSQPIKWLYQMCVESFLYHHEDEARGTGAFYRLLQRTPGAAGRALCLRKTSVGDGLITDAEWDFLREPLLSCVRVLTLVPIDVAAKAITVYGETERSAALIQALGYDRPAEWDEGGEEQDDGDEEGDAPHDDADDDDGECSGDHSEGEVSVAPTEEFEYNSDREELGDASGGADGSVGGRQAKKGSLIKYTLVVVPPALQRELDEFVQWRTLTVNSERNGVCVEAITAAGNRSDALRLLGWLKTERNVAPSLCAVFGSGRLGPAVQQFVAHLRSSGRTFTTCAGYIKSFAVIARFVHAARTARAPNGTVISSTPVDAMHGLLTQTKQQGRLEEKFSGKPLAWLDWGQVQTARARAVRVYESAVEGGTEAAGTLHKMLFEATLLTWLTSAPPDRVGVSRQLRLGDTLNPTDNGFDLDLSRPGQHKTSAAFGPTITAVPAPAAALLTAWLSATGRTSAAQPHVFVPGTDASKPLAAPQWTKLVKAVFMTHAGVPLAPKELRSSFITFLRSEDNSDAALKSAAFAMRHSSKQARGPAYDKERAERLSAAAVQVAGAYAAGFK